MKIFNNIEEINGVYGVSVSLPHIFPYDMYAVFEVIRPNHVEYCGFSSESGISFLSKYSVGKVLIVCKPIVKDMEQYIREYIHLVGCEFKHGKSNGVFISRVTSDHWSVVQGKPTIIDNLGYIYSLERCKFYLDDETLGTYEEYMELHYPQYKHIWKHQL